MGTPQRIKDVATIVTDGEQKIVVLSAMAKTTNTLIEISDYLYKKNPEGANDVINRLEHTYIERVNELFASEEYRDKTLASVRDIFNYIRSFTKDVFTPHEEKAIVAQGELLSTTMFLNYLLESGVKAAMLPALEYMRTDVNSEPDLQAIRNNLLALLKSTPEADIYVTQGFICRNSYGEVDNLKRGGSDYTASLIGAAIDADEIQIWTDIDGMHNNDPRFVDKTTPVRNLHFEEAAELA